MGAGARPASYTLIGSIFGLVVSVLERKLIRGRRLAALHNLFYRYITYHLNGVRSVLFAVSGSQGTRRELPVSRSPGSRSPARQGINLPETVTSVKK